MTVFPLDLPRLRFLGFDTRKREHADRYNQDVSTLESYVNRLVEEGRFGRYLYSSIARESGIDRERVAEILIVVNGGSNGFTIEAPTKSGQVFMAGSHLPAE